MVEYMVVENEGLELPIASDSTVTGLIRRLKEGRLLDTIESSCYRIIKRGSVIRLNDGRWARIIKIDLDEEE